MEIYRIINKVTIKIILHKKVVTNSKTKVHIERIFAYPIKVSKSDY